MRIARKTITDFFIGSAALSIAFFSGGCGVLIGNTRPVAEKSELYHVQDMAKANPDWVKLDSKSRGDEPSDDPADKTEYSDLAFKSKSTDAVIALNSACRPSYERTGKNLQIFTQQMLMGMSHITEKKQEPVTVDGVDGLQTTVTGILAGARVRMRIIDLHKGKCVYDVMYLSHPDKFTVREEEFSHFVASLRLQ